MVMYTYVKRIITPQYVESKENKIKTISSTLDKVKHHPYTWTPMIHLKERGEKKTNHIAAISILTARQQYYLSTKKNSPNCFIFILVCRLDDFSTTIPFHKVLVINEYVDASSISGKINKITSNSILKDRS